LHNFISDIRNSKNKDDERVRVDKELANIRQKFSNSAGLSSYDKKKYVWKLCYIYMLGYEVDFGHVEFISLLSSTKFQEKSVGYMAFSMMFRPGDELMTLAVNSMRNDICSQINSSQSLALAAVSNMGGSDLAEALSADVQRLVNSPSEVTGSYQNINISVEQEYRNRSFLCKKAAMCLLRLYRTNPDCVVVEEWMRRIAKLLEDRDFGVITSILSLLLGFASTNTAVFEPLIPYVISILTRLVVNHSCPQEYLYCGIASPWLQVKCLRFLQYYKIPSDATQLDLLNEVLVKTLVRPQNHDYGHDSTNKNNAENSILFEAINLIISYGADCPEQLREQALTLLGKFINLKDANIRYLSIDAMTRLAKLEGPHVVEPYQTAVLDSLKDTDISLRKRALILLYVMAYENNARDIVEELVKNLVIADSTIKEDIVVKIAILAEKYSKDFKWYVDTMVQVIIVAGDYVAEAVWFRVVQVVINNTDIHEYAAEKMHGLVQAKFAHEIVVAISAYLLGEIGVNICDKPGMTGYDQFVALHQHFANAHVKVQGILLTTYIKFVNLYPEQCKDLIVDIFSKYSTSSQLELQQRAVEYLALCRVDASTVETVLNTMPAFELDKRENILLTIEATEGKSADRSAWSVDQGEKAASRASAVAAKANDAAAAAAAASSSSNTRSGAPSSSATQAAKPAPVIDLLSLDDDYSAPTSSNNGARGEPSDADLKDLFKKAALVHGASQKAVVYENDAFALNYMTDFRNHQGRIAIFLQAKQAIGDIHIACSAPEGLNLRAQASDLPSVAAGEEARILLAAEAMRPFNEVPTLTLTYSVRGTSSTANVKLPISVLSFASPMPSDKMTYMNRWKAIIAERTENQLVFTCSKPVDATLMQYIRDELMPAARIGVAEGLDNERTFTGSTTFNTGTNGADGKPIAVGALMRLEADFAGGKFRITVRATHPVVSAAVKDFFVNQLS
jgi:AP-2 complex subunit alpha